MPTPNPDESEIRDRLKELLRRIALERHRGTTAPLALLRPGNEIASLEGSLNHVKRLLELHGEALTLLADALPDRDATS